MSPGLTLRDIGTSQNDGGPRYEVGRDTLLDWQYREADGRMRGSFLAVALMHHRESKGGWLSPLMRRERDLLAEYKLWEA